MGRSGPSVRLAASGRPAGLWLVLVGILSIVFPELLGNGQDLAQSLFLHPFAPLAFAALVLLRPLATVCFRRERRAGRLCSRPRSPPAR